MYGTLNAICQIIDFRNYNYAPMLMCGLYSYYGGALLGISCVVYVSVLGSCIV